MNHCIQTSARTVGQICEKGEKMAEKLYYLFFNGERICESIRLDDALVLIEAFCRKYYNESSFKFELVELERCVSGGGEDGTVH